MNEGNLPAGHRVWEGVGDPIDIDEPDAPAVVTDAQERYREAYLAHRGHLVGLAHLLGAPGGVVEDVVDDAFVAAFVPWRDGRVDDLRAYLRRAVVNNVYGRGRHERAGARWLARQPAVPDAVPADDRFVEHARLVGALRALSPELRTAVVLRFCEDMSEHDAADVMGVALGTVKSRTARGLERLRTILEGDDDDA